MSHTKVLRAPPESPESALPAHVSKLARPAALQKATQLAFLRFDKADLDEAQRFWIDFGLITDWAAVAPMPLREATHLHIVGAEAS